MKHAGLPLPDTSRRNVPSLDGDVTDGAPSIASASPSWGGGESADAALEGLSARFEILELLGRGGMGSVYRARDRRLGREVAVKVLSCRGDTGAQLIEAEARALARLEHDHVVRVYELALERGVPYLVMELMRGWPLSTRLAEGRPTLVESVRIAVDVLKALSEAHRQGVVHRDVKPGNVFIETSGRIKVADFGLASMVEGSTADAITADAIVGTPAYMAPEQRTGSLVGPAADVYAAGLVLHEMLTGRRAAEPRGHSGLEAPEPIPPPSAVNAHVPAELDAAVGRALAVKPHDRPAADELIAELSAWLEASSAAVRRAGRADVPPHPYKFLDHYGPADRAIFFGRDAEVAELSALLADPVARVLQLFGPCGIGKSSLVHAGLVPALAPERFEVIALVSGADPAGAIRTAVASRLGAPAGGARGDGALAAGLAAHGRSTGKTVVLVVDQLEELFTHNPRGSARVPELFALVEALAADQALPVRVVLSYRTEFRGALHALEERLGRLQRAVPMREIAEAGLVEVVEGPSRVPAYRFRYQDGFATYLVEQIVTHTRGAGEATLPVLQIVCRQLFDRMRSAAQDLVGWDLFESTLGGVGGVLGRFVEDRLASPDYGPRAPIARQILKMLTLKDGAERFSRARDEEEVLGFPDREAARMALDRLVEDHLIVREESNGVRRVRLASEVICPLIDGWSVETGDVDRAARVLARGLRQWEDGGGRSEDLLSGAALQLVDRNVGALRGLGERETAFVDASRARRRRRRAAGAVAALAALALVGAFAYARWLEPGTLELTSDPAGAVVKRGDEVLGRTPIQVALRPGSHGLTLEHARHDSARVDVNVPAGGATRYHTVLRYPFGMLSVNTEPGGCVATLSDARTHAAAGVPKTTPFLTELPAGRYTMTLAKPGFVQTTVGPFTLGPNRELVPQTVRLEKDAGSLVLKVAMPGCQATVAPEAEPDRPLWQGALPAVAPIELPAGRYRVRTVSADGAADVRSVSIARRTTSSLTAWLDFAKPLWEARTPGEVIGTPGLADLDGDGLPDVVAGTTDSKVVAVSGRTGNVLWTFEASGHVAASPAFADLDRDGVPDVVIGSQDRFVHALSGKTGRELWRVTTGNFVSSTAAIADVNADGVPDAAVGSNDNHLYMVSGKDGAVIWKAALGGLVISSPALADLDADGVVDAAVGSFDGTIRAFSGKDGRPLWSVKTGGAVMASPKLADFDGDGTKDAVVGSLDGELRCISGKTGRVLWQWHTGSKPRRPEDMEGSCALADLDRDGVPDVVLGTLEGVVVALSGKSHVPLWTQRTEGRIDSTPALADFTRDGVPDVAIACGDRKLRVLDGRDGRQRLAIDTEGLFGQSPATGDLDRDGFPEMVIGTRGGRLRAYTPVLVTARWAFQASGVLESAPAAADLDGDGVLDLVLGTGSGAVHAVSGRDGRELWTHTTGGAVYSSPALLDIDGDRTPDLVFGSMDGKVRAVSGRNGRLLWSFATGAAMTAPVSVGSLGKSGRVAAVSCSWNGMLHGVTVGDGVKRFEVQLGGRPFVQPVIADVTGDGKADVLAAADGVGLLAYDLANGKLLWRHAVQQEIRANLTAADMDADGATDVVFGGIDGRLRVVSGRTGKSLWERDLEGEIWFAPALGDLDGDGRPDVVAVTKRGRVVAASGRDGRSLWEVRLSGELMHPALVFADADDVPDVMVTAGESGLQLLSGRDGSRIGGVPMVGIAMMAAPLLADLEAAGRTLTWRDGRELRPIARPAAPRRSLTLVHVQFGMFVVAAELPWPPAGR